MVLILLVALATGALGMEESGLLVNPSFDEPLELEPPECDEAAGWHRWGSWANRHTNQPGWEARHGCGLIAYHHWQSDSPDAGWYQEVTNLAGGCVYRFAVHAKWEPPCNASNVELRIETPGGTNVLAVETYTGGQVRPNWTYLWVHGRLPRDLNAARFVIRCTHGFGGSTAKAIGCIKFDDAAVSRVAR